MEFYCQEKRRRDGVGAEPSGLFADWNANVKSAADSSKHQ
jgi:hypothetical protein